MIGLTLAEMITRGDAEGARRKAHELKGTAGNLGAATIARASAALEVALMKGLHAELALARFRSDLTAGLSAIRSALANRPGGWP